MNELTAATVFVKALVFAAGTGVTYFAYRAHRRTGAAGLRSLALGFAAITAGAVTGGGVDRMLGIGTELGLLSSSLLIAVGFGLLIRALYVSDDRFSVPDLVARTDRG